MIFGQPMPAVAAAAVLVTIASTLQATIGYGLALLAVPLLHLSGFPPVAAIVISSSAMMVQMSNGVVRLHISLTAQKLAWPLFIIIPTMLVGVLALRSIVSANPDLARQAAGFVVIVALGVLRIVRPEPTPRVARPWTLLAMSTSGILSGLTGMGGAPLAIWSYAHTWSAERIRATIWAIALPTTAVQLTLLIVTFGMGAVRTLMLAAVLAPCALVGSNVGLSLARRLSMARLRNAAFVVLTILGVSAVIRPFF